MKAGNFAILKKKGCTAEELQQDLLLNQRRNQLTEMKWEAKEGVSCGGNKTEEDSMVREESR
eukprot:10188374-Ditylum_brightwellii.AAC.1